MSTVKIPCIEDAAYIGMATEQANSITQEAFSWAAIQIALLVAQDMVSTFISSKQENLANRRYTMAKEAMDHAKKTWPFESSFVSETMAEAKYSPEYSYVPIMLNEAQRTEDLALASSDFYMQRLGLSGTPCGEARIRRGMATARTDLVSHSMRAAEARSIALNDRRYSRQLAVVGMGRGKLQTAMALGTLADSGEAIRASLMNTINSGMALWGYTTNRWTHGGNYATGENGAPTVVPPGMEMLQRTGPTGETYYSLARMSEVQMRDELNQPAEAQAFPVEV